MISPSSIIMYLAYADKNLRNQMKKKMPYDQLQDRVFHRADLKKIKDTFKNLKDGIIILHMNVKLTIFVYPTKSDPYKYTCNIKKTPIL